MMLTIFLSSLAVVWIALAIATCVREWHETRYDGGVGG